MYRRTLTGAWIETFSSTTGCATLLVAPSRVRGLKLNVKQDAAKQESSHPHGCVD